MEMVSLISKILQMELDNNRCFKTLITNNSCYETIINSMEAIHSKKE